MTFQLPGIDKAATNARAATKRRSDDQLLTMMHDFKTTVVREREIRDELNPVVAKKRALEVDLVQNMVARGFRWFVAEDGRKLEIVPRTMEQPDAQELKERLEEIGLSDDQILAVRRAITLRSKRFKYDVLITEPIRDAVDGA